MEIIGILQALMVISIISFGAYTVISLSYFYNNNKISLRNLILIFILIMGFVMVNSMVMVKLDELKRFLQ
jgi:uncharacterized membrane protein YcaP (DUF421 family)